MKKNIKIMALAGVAAVTVVGGTFAYYNATQTFQNPFNTNHYGTSATEKFNPGDGDDWKPGADVPKTVKATNTGTSDVWVRVSFNEIWTLEDERTIDWNSGEIGFNITEGMSIKDAVYQDGDATNDLSSVVIKHFADGNIVSVAPNEVAENTQAGKWYKLGEYYYYTAAVTPGQSTVPLLNSVELHKDVDMGLFDNNIYFTVVDRNANGTSKSEPVFSEKTKDNWKKVKDDAELKQWLDTAGRDRNADLYTYKENVLVADQKLHGYANSNYELDITVDFVQATDEAADASGWDWNPSMIQPAAAEP